MKENSKRLQILFKRVRHLDFSDLFSVIESKSKNREKLFLSIFLPTLEFEIIMFIIPTDRPLFVMPSARRTIN